MRDSKKVVIGLGSIWGTFALGAVLWASFTLGSNDTTPEIASLILYGLTILPSCILAIWFPRGPATWLIFLACVSLFGFSYQLAVQRPASQAVWLLLWNIGKIFLLATIPGLLGFSLLRTARPHSTATDRQLE